MGACAHGRRKRYQYYACGGKMKHGECDISRIPKKILEEAIFRQLKEIFSNEALVNKLVKKVNAKLKRISNTFEDVIKTTLRYVLREKWRFRSLILPSAP